MKHGRISHKSPRIKGLRLRLAGLATLGLALSGAPAPAQAAAPTENPEAAAFYVAPDGSDAWSGLLDAPDAKKADGPFATLARARDAARAAKAASASARARIVVRGGEFFLDAPLELTAEDSGLTIEAASGEKPILYGGRRLYGWGRDGDRFWSAAVPDVAGRKWDFRMLAVDGRMCPRARLPQKGTFSHLSEFKVKWGGGPPSGWAREPTHEELTTMIYRPEDLGSWLDIKNAELTVFHMWHESVVGLAANDTARHTLTFSNPSDAPPGAYGVQKYVVWNVREGMTEPGQWYLDRTAGKVVYWPLPGEDMAKAVAMAPTMDSVVEIQGDVRNPVRNVGIRGLKISVANTPLEAGGFNAGKYPGAIQIEHAENCFVENFEVSCVAGQGIKAEFVTDLRVDSGEIHDTGASGFFSRESLRITVSNNRVHHVGRIYPSGNGILSTGHQAHTTHNEVHDTPYNGIMGSGDGLCIEHNLIYRVMQELHDGGGIYIVGRGRGMVLRGNVIRDVVDTGGYGASSYYLDEQCTGVLVEGNLSLGVVRPLKCHIGNRNTIRDNVFIDDGGDIMLDFPRSKDQRMERNVVRAKGKITIRTITAISEASGNVLFSEAGMIHVLKTKIAGDVPTAFEYTDGGPLASDDRWTLADPQFREFAGGRVRYAEGSPTAALGIRPIDVSDAGVSSNPGRL